MLCGQLPSVYSGNCVKHLKTWTNRRVLLVKYGTLKCYAHFCLSAWFIPVSQTTISYLYCSACLNTFRHAVNKCKSSFPLLSYVLVGSSVAQCLSTEPAASFVSRWNTSRQGPQLRRQIRYCMHGSINCPFQSPALGLARRNALVFQKHASVNSWSVMRDCVLAWLWSVQLRRLDCPTPRSLPY